MNIELLLLGTCVLSIKMLTDMFTKEKKLKEAYQATLDLWYYWYHWNSVSDGKYGICLGFGRWFEHSGQTSAQISSIVLIFFRMFCATVHVVVSQILLWKFCAGNWWSRPRLILKPMLDVWQLCCGLVKNFPKELENGWKVKCTTISSASRVSNVGTTIWVQAGIACPIWIHREKKKCCFEFWSSFSWP